MPDRTYFRISGLALLSNTLFSLVNCIYNFGKSFSTLFSFVFRLPIYLFSIAVVACKSPYFVRQMLC